LYLLDTNVVSELRKAKPHGAVLAWLANVPDRSLYVSSVTFGEIQVGIENARRSDPEKAVEIEAWAEDLMSKAQVLSPDAPIFRLWAKLMVGRSQDMYEDALIAATAIRHDFTVVTRNIRDFRHFDVRTFNPFAGK
jgi:predicted nucleic acid-binding protein